MTRLPRRQSIWDSRVEAFLDQPLGAAQVGAGKVNPAFVDALKKLKVDTVEDLVRLNPERVPTALDATYARADVLGLKDLFISFLWIEHGKTQAPDLERDEIEREVHSVLLYAEGVDRTARWEQLVEMCDSVAVAGRDLTFDMRRHVYQVQDVWPPWPSPTPAEGPPTDGSRPTRRSSELPDEMRMMLPGISRQLAPKWRADRERLVDRLKKKYRAAARLFQNSGEEPFLRRALGCGPEDVLPPELPIASDASYMDVERIAFAFASVALRLAVERAQLPLDQDFARQRRGRVGAIPRKAAVWAPLERWRRQRNVTYYQIAKVILTSQILREYFDPAFDLDFTVAKLEDRLSKLLGRSSA